MDISELDLDLGNNDFFGNLNAIGLEGEPLKTKKDTPTQKDTTQKLSSISKQAMEALEKDDILPLPENFEAYFEKTLLQEQDEHMREKIKAVVESTNRDARLIELEKTFNDNFSTLKNILEQLLILCKQMSAMENNTESRLLEIQSITNPLGTQNAIKVLINEIRGFHKQFVSSADSISKSYREMYSQFSNTKQSAMYDTMLGVYNKSFFMHTLELECKNGKEFPRHCALIVFTPAKQLASQLNNQNKLVVTFKNIAKVVSKNIGTKDVISYLGGGKFGILLKNVQPNGAVELCENVIKKCKDTHIFIDDLELSLSIVMGGIVFDCEKTPESMLDMANTTLSSALSEEVSLKFDNKISNPQNEENLNSALDGLDDLSDFDLS